MSREDERDTEGQPVRNRILITGGAGFIGSHLADHLLGSGHRVQGERPQVHFGAWRPADQRYYVSDSRQFSQATGWAPKIAAREGVHRLFQWLKANRAPRPEQPALEQNLLN